MGMGIGDWGLDETKLQQEDSLLSLDEMQEIALNVLSEKTDRSGRAHV